MSGGSAGGGAKSSALPKPTPVYRKCVVGERVGVMCMGLGTTNCGRL